MKEKETNNVIPFPKPKTQPSETPQRGNLYIGLENKKVMISTSIASVLFLVTVINASLTSVNKEKQERGIASLSSHSLQRNTDSEYQLALKLAKRKGGDRSIASIGRAPSSEDKLVYGLLGGKYHVKYNEGKITEVTFPSSNNSMPSYVTDREQFLQKYRELFAVDYTKVKKGSANTADDQLLESYNLFGRQDQRRGQVHFKLDKYQRMISMRFHN